MKLSLLSIVFFLLFILNNCFACNTDIDCNDDDLCTIDHCILPSQICEHELIHQCISNRHNLEIAHEAQEIYIPYIVIGVIASSVILFLILKGIPNRYTQ